MDKMNLLNSIRKYLFYALDLNLYLDNFPDCKEAMEDYKKVNERLCLLTTEYETNYGQLTNFGMGADVNSISWTEEPWPWENQSRGCCR